MTTRNKLSHVDRHSCRRSKRCPRAFRRAVMAACSLVVFLCATAERATAQMRIEVEAAAGQPFGVGRITVGSGGDFRVNVPRLDPERRGGRIGELARRLATQAGMPRESMTLETAEMSLVEKSGRVFYPVFEKRERPILREFISVPKQVTVFFLFQGDAPLELTVYAPQPQVGRVVPRTDAASYDRLLRAWWRDYSAATDGRNTPQDFSPLVEEYLVDTLSRRLRLDLPEPVANDKGLFQSQFNLLMGTEQARQEVTRTILLADGPPQIASEPIPQELPQPKPEVLNPAETEVEPLALKVPVECFYVRFGSFTNFLWLRHRLEEWGGEVRDILSERGLDYGLNERMQRQLGLRESKLAELLGESVIADVAMIGTDTFLSEGAAIGVMFQARNNLALTADLGQQRVTAVKDTPGAKQEKVTINDRPVSFIYAPDNSLRSYYVFDGEFHLVTTSRAIVESFLATAAGKHESLGGSEEFRLARKHMPLDRNDTVFAYFSPAFFQNLLSPHYQVELKRRLRSAVEIDLVQIARLAATSEQRPHETIEELVAGGFLPGGFGQRADGSRLEVDGANIFDSLRGPRGAFVPVPDVPVDRVTPDELRDYRQFAEKYAAEWGSMDPIVAGIQRQALPKGGLERVVIDVKAAPLSQRHSEMLANWLGPATNKRLAPIEGDLVSFEAVMRGGSFFSGGDHHLFGALRDADPAIALDPSAGLIAQIFTSQLSGLQGYLGAWPDPGFLRMLSGPVQTRPDANGYSRLITGATRRQWDQYTLMSFHPEILARISPQLRFEEVDRPAQIWFRADDLANSQLAPLVNAYGYRQSRQIALGNTRYMNMLVEQLHVPGADALATAEQLLGAELLEPLGGKYELREAASGQKTWISTSLAEHPDAKQPPADYQFPALNWLRGIQLEAVTENGLLALHGEVIMPAETKPTGLSLPGLPLGKPAAGAPQAKPKPKPKAAPPLPVPAKKPAGTRDF